MRLSLFQKLRHAWQAAGRRHDPDEALLSPDELNRQIIASVREGIVVFDTALRYRAFNPYMEELSGLKASTIFGKRPSEVLPLAFAAKVEAEVRRALAGESFLLPDWWVSELPSAPAAWVSVKMSPLTNARGRIVGALSVVHDVTERKLSEEEMRRWESIFRHAGWGVVLADPYTDKILVANAAFARMHGYRDDEAIGLNLSDVFAPESREALTLGMRIVRELGHHVYESPHLRKDGTRFPALADVTVILDDNGRPRYRVANVRDITEQKNAEERFSELSERLTQLSHQLIVAQESERRFLARELHDQIGQALTALKINLQTTAKTATHENVVLIDDILKQVRDLSFNLRPSLLDDLGLAAALSSHCARACERANVAFRFDARIPAVRFEPATETACFRVAQEALTNALRHARASEVEVTLAREDGLLVMTLTDNGIGFDVGSAQKDAAHGASLGMLSMQERALLAGGGLSIDSGPGVPGTRVCATFAWKILSPVREAVS
jgi:PAS domain S-box-containing protein